MDYTVKKLLLTVKKLLLTVKKLLLTVKKLLLTKKLWPERLASKGFQGYTNRSKKVLKRFKIDEKQT